jgi:ATP-binding cassette subfamily F protein 3
VDPEETVSSYTQRWQGNLQALSAELQELAVSLAAQPMRADLQSRYDEVLAEIESASEAQGTIEATLAAFGLDTLPGDLPVTALSGGQKTRVGLAGLLLSHPHLLLLDEPTNHLDFAMLDWLEDWLNRSDAALLIVSHDRVFLDHTVDSIFELDGQTHHARLYSGNYSEYLLAKEAEMARQWQSYTDQQVEIKRLQAAAQHYRRLATFKKGGKADTPDKFAKAFFANRGLATVRRAKSVEKRVEHLLTDEKIDKPHSSWQMKMEFADTSASSRLVLAMSNLSIGYTEIPLLSGLDQSIRFGERVLLFGPNGCGKSTLLRTLAGQLPPLAGRFHLGASVNMGSMAQDQGENLDPALTVLTSLQRVAALNETNARNLLHKYLFTGDEALLPVAQCSFGMRARLVLACLVAQGCNLLLLDEPLNHLDIPSRSQFEQALSDFEGTILAVSHDRYFIQRFATQIWEIDDGELLAYPPHHEEL